MQQAPAIYFESITMVTIYATRKSLDLHYVISLILNKRFSTGSNPEINSQQERQNSIIKTYIQVFINDKQVQISIKVFALAAGCAFFSISIMITIYISHKKDIELHSLLSNLCSRLQVADELVNNLINSMPLAET